MQPAVLYGLPSIPLDDDGCQAAQYLRWSFATLGSAISRLINGLREAGVKEGDPVFTFLHSGVEYLLVT